MSVSLVTSPPPETLAKRSARCKLCADLIRADEHYIAKLPRLGWVHARCAKGYRQVIAEHAEESDS